MPLRGPPKQSRRNDALYTNNTLALDPDTGVLRWRFSHLPNDQWDLDWAFERQIFDLRVGARVKRVVATAGKPAVYDVLEADTGKYLFSADLGLQDLISHIDPVTGAKTVDRRREPGDGTVKPVCPHDIGGKNWLPSAYSPQNSFLYVSLNETCMDFTPIAEGETSLMSSRVRMNIRPRPGSDGLYGRLEALNLLTHQPAWVQRRRAPITTGVLNTGGGLVFAGYLDRAFIAYDSLSGQELWKTRLNDVPNSNAITYMVNGVQYVAVIAANGGPMPGLLSSLVPEIKNASNRTGTLWVFKVR
jgi:alcohol dehydrogenase (cytochrome c)